ncbi:predicted protein [Naegleria gruberi]|uniref:Predicted protein n=1 Tax=Naegleria gruberi TaxID=5762 RepID=D2VP60_NAEGR|nr:uncharacterized protein NAEGRDRAFT_70742 [Naegleria gruberi]EFC41375.1 predicted protein [Naegleria gruberi]|eukprot:XP_002674119.1 predicted protein [Naegleria gruberi strain NEG-M]
MVVGKELSSTASYSEQPSAYIIPELNTQFCLACTTSESMAFQENIESNNDTRDTQLLFVSVGNEDASKVEISLQAIPKLGKKIVLVLSSMNVVTFNIKIEESFPLERVICHSPIQSSVVFSPFYEHQTVKNIPVDYYCVKGSNCSYKILVTTSTVSWYGGGQVFTELMSNHLNLEWRAFASCGRATRIAVQPIGWPCAALSDELIIYITLTLFLFSVSFISCIVLVLLRWYCIRVRAREEYLLQQANMDFVSEEDLKSDSKVVQLKTTTIITTTNTAPIIQV